MVESKSIENDSKVKKLNIIKSTNNLVPPRLRERFQKAGQDHIFQWVGELSKEELSSFLKQLEAVDIEWLLQSFNSAREAALGMTTTSCLQPTPLRNDDIIQAKVEVDWELGIRTIKEGKLGVITLAGGQGTRLGSTAPKGCYDIGLPSGSSLFELQALRIRKLASLAEVSQIPWYIMTSEATHMETVNFFKAKDYFGLKETSVRFFKQGELPALTEDGKLILKSKGSLALSPNGNGGVYSALLKEGILKELKEKNIEYLHMYCVDNLLVRPGDPSFIGACLKAKTDCGAKSIIKKDPKESVGIFCRRQSDGKIIVAEYSELDPSIAAQMDPKGGENLLYNQANIANHFFTLKFLQKVAESPLIIHLARKKIPSIDKEGRRRGVEESSSPPLMGFKMEFFIFDVFEQAERAIVYQGERSEEFAPLKNAPGAEYDSPDYCREMLLNLHSKWLLQAGAQLNGKVELSPLLSFSGEGLESFKGKVVAATTGYLKSE